MAVEEAFVPRHRLPARLLVDSGGMRVQSGKKGGTGWSTDGALAVCIREQDAPLGKAINIRGACLGMSIEAANPVIEVIDGDE